MRTGAKDNMDLRDDITRGTAIADIVFDEGGNGRGDDALGSFAGEGIGELAEKGAAKLGSSIFEVVI